MKIIITGGGTGGHVFPGLAVAEELISRKFTVLYVGTAGGLESRLVPPKGIPFFTVRSGAFKNQSFLKRIRSFGNLLDGIRWAISFLRKERPAAVLGVGGYVSVPVCLAAFFLGIPIYLQEQNVSVGIANRFLGKLAKKVFLGFDQAAAYFSKKKCIVTGNPVRKEFYVETPKINLKYPCLLVLGGSQGARSINEAMVHLVSKISEKFPDTTIIHQTGDKDFQWVRAAYEKDCRNPFVIMPFISDIYSTYLKATLVLSRSGALTVSEIVQVSRPAIFVPYPRKGQNDQTANAYFLREHGVAQVVEQGEEFEPRLWAAIQETFQTEILAEMVTKFSGLRRPDALASIGDQIERDLKV
ncbi:MAG: undecaprenyldiphospho-muramoylpentapeptide beta-N-acetylglucosaminyltransferase [Deltaproteobacteria bacterium]|nr:undecaprenyldiphospho-muramoylpentapeptide beta-N-acetylglucosaminyltransferase [Deltaproteobacteria bacterium]